jgi:hypothetical protein
LLIEEKGTNSTHCSVEEKFNKSYKEVNKKALYIMNFFYDEFFYQEVL